MLTYHFIIFFFNDTATTEIYTLSLHDALPIFRDQGLDVLLFVDNIFRFTQAGSEVSALLGRMPSAVGYQPNLATEMGELQERITSTRTEIGRASCRERV